MTTVLVVDDEFGLLEVLVMVLEDEGFDVVSALNGRDGLASVKTSSPDVILLDYMMPIVDGVAMLLALRADPNTASIPVIMMSAVPSSALRDRCDYDAFLRKPFETPELLATLARVLAIGPRTAPL